MKVAVWDTYVTMKDGTVMHFDIIVPETVNNAEVIYGYGCEYLRSKGLDDLPITSRECKLCHVETLRHDWEDMINRNGYCIFEMENCN